MKHPQDVILKPVLTEKSYDAIPGKRYTFIVDKNATKTEVRQAVEEIFSVKVDRVNILNKLGKMKRQGVHLGRRPATKKAFVTLKSGSKGIEFFDTMSQ